MRGRISGCLTANIPISEGQARPLVQLSVKVFDKMAHFLDRSQSAVYIEPQAEINAGVVCGLGVFPQVELDRRQSVEQIASIGIGDGPFFRPLQVLVAVEHWEILTQPKPSSAALIENS